MEKKLCCFFYAYEGHPIRADIQIMKEFFNRIRFIFTLDGLYIIPTNNDDSIQVESITFRVFIPAKNFQKYICNKENTVVSFYVNDLNEALNTVKKKESIQISILSDLDGAITQMDCSVSAKNTRESISGVHSRPIPVYEEKFSEDMTTDFDDSIFELPVKFQSAQFTSLKKSMKVHKNNIKIIMQKDDFLQILSGDQKSNSSNTSFTVGAPKIPFDKMKLLNDKNQNFEAVYKQCDDFFIEEFESITISKLNKISSLSEMISFYMPKKNSGYNHVLKITIPNGKKDPLGEFQVFIKDLHLLKQEHDSLTKIN